MNTQYCEKTETENVEDLHWSEQLLNSDQSDAETFDPFAFYETHLEKEVTA